MSDANVAPFRYAVSQGGERNTIVATADYYEGPFGTVMIHPNRVQAGSAKLARNASFLWLRGIQEDKAVANTGDVDKGVIIGEGTLKVRNEKGLGVAAGLFGLMLHADWRTLSLAGVIPAAVLAA